MKTFQTNTEILIEDNPLKVKADYHIANDGIGSYEYWGAKCFDRGTDYPEIDNIEPIWTNESEEEKKDILIYIDEHFEDLANGITESMMDNQDGYL